MDVSIRVRRSTEELPYPHRLRTDHDLPADSGQGDDDMWLLTPEFPRPLPFWWSLDHTGPPRAPTRQRGVPTRPGSGTTTPHSLRRDTGREVAGSSSPCRSSGRGQFSKGWNLFRVRLRVSELRGTTEDPRRHRPSGHGEGRESGPLRYGSRNERCIHTSAVVSRPETDHTGRDGTGLNGQRRPTDSRFGHCLG